MRKFIVMDKMSVIVPVYMRKHQYQLGSDIAKKMKLYRIFAGNDRNLKI